MSTKKNALRAIIVSTIAVAIAVACGIAKTAPFPPDPGNGDWPMWGGTPDRNMISNMKGLPICWDVKAKKNIKWIAALGSQTSGHPVVAAGQIYVGTNNAGVRAPKAPGA